MMDLELKGELPAPRSSFSIFDPKIHLAKGGCQNKSDGWCAAGRWRGIKAGLGRAAGQYGEVSLLPIQATASNLSVKLLSGALETTCQYESLHRH